MDISKHLGEWELRYVWTQPFTFSIVRYSGNFAVYGTNRLAFQLFGRVGTSLCMDPTIYFFNCLVKWELRYVWTHPLTFQLIGRVGTSLCMDPAILFFNYLGEWELGYVWTETFSLSIIR
jgi:hypothetical protein